MSESGAGAQPSGGEYESNDTSPGYVTKLEASMGTAVDYAAATPWWLALIIIIVMFALMFLLGFMLWGLRKKREGEPTVVVKEPRRRVPKRKFVVNKVFEEEAESDLER